ncbi:MAG: antitoxin [Glaciecola sp.]|jgi:putative toxin-antitoxin system antitoxin component (TIGR02293 family)
MCFRKVLRQQTGLPASDIEIHNAICRGLPFSVFVRISTIPDIQHKELATCLAISKGTLNQSKQSGSFTQNKSDRLYRFTEILAVITIGYFEGSQSDAVAWPQSEVKALGYSRPNDLLLTSAGNEKNQLSKNSYYEGRKYLR